MRCEIDSLLFSLLRSFLRLRGWREGNTEERNSLSMFMNKAHLVQQKNNVAREPIAVSPLQSERSEDKEREREKKKTTNRICKKQETPAKMNAF